MPLNGLEELNKDAICGQGLPFKLLDSILIRKLLDVIAVVKEASELGEITSSKLQRQVCDSFHDVIFVQ